MTGFKVRTSGTFSLFAQELGDESFEKSGWVLPFIKGRQPRGDGLPTLIGNVAEESWIFLLDRPQVEGFFLNESHQKAVKKLYGLGHSAVVEIIGQNLCHFLDQVRIWLRHFQFHWKVQGTG
jgi:hypothetical protein